MFSLSLSALSGLSHLHPQPEFKDASGLRPVADCQPSPTYILTLRPTIANASCWPKVLSSLRVM